MIKKIQNCFGEGTGYIIGNIIYTRRYVVSPKYRSMRNSPQSENRDLKQIVGLKISAIPRQKWFVEENIATDFFEQLEKLSKNELDKMRHREDVYRTMLREPISQEDIERLIDLETRMLECSFPLIKQGRYNMPGFFGKDYVREMATYNLKNWGYIAQRKRTRRKVNHTLARTFPYRASLSLKK